MRNLLHHVIPEYVTQMLVCGLAFAVMGQLPVIIVMAGFTTLFAGRDDVGSRAMRTTFHFESSQWLAIVIRGGRLPRHASYLPR